MQNVNLFYHTTPSKARGKGDFEGNYLGYLTNLTISDKIKRIALLLYESEVEDEYRY